MLFRDPSQNGLLTQVSTADGCFDAKQLYGLHLTLGPCLCEHVNVDVHNCECMQPHIVHHCARVCVCVYVCVHIGVRVSQRAWCLGMVSGHGIVCRRAWTVNIPSSDNYFPPKYVSLHISNTFAATC